MVLPPVVDPDDLFTLYPVRHANGYIVYSLTPESQKLWQDFADKEVAELERRARLKNTA